MTSCALRCACGAGLTPEFLRAGVVHALYAVANGFVVKLRIASGLATAVVLTPLDTIIFKTKPVLVIVVSVYAAACSTFDDL